MKKTILFSLLISCSFTLFAQRALEVGTPIISGYKTSGNRLYKTVEYNGFMAKIVHTEYVGSDSVEILFAYAFWGANTAEFTLNELKPGKKSLIQKWTFDSTQKTGTFLVNRRIRQSDQMELSLHLIDTTQTVYMPWCSESFCVDTRTRTILTTEQPMPVTTTLSTQNRPATTNEVWYGQRYPDYRLNYLPPPYEYKEPYYYKETAKKKN